MKKTLRTASVLAVMSIAASMASAQSPATPASAPAAVGVTSSTAAEANQKAVQRSDTGTLVRTSPTAAERAKTAADNIGSSNSATSSNVDTTTRVTTPGNRAPRSDRQ